MKHWNTTYGIRSNGRHGLARRKLGDEHGASIVLAMVIFVIASIFCVTIVNAALSSSGNTRDQIADEQDFLAASSAAKMLQDVVPGKGVTLKGLDSVTDAEKSCKPDDDAGEAKALLQAMGESLLLKDGEDRTDDYPEVTVNAPGNMPKVTVTMIPSGGKDNYDVTALVKGERGNAMAVNFKGSGNAQDQSGSSVYVVWRVQSVGKQGQSAADSGKKKS